jgi:hypothetical protein
VAIVLPDTVQVRLNWSLSGQPWAQNVLHYRVPSGFVVNSTTTEAFGAAVIGAFTTAGSLAPRISTSVALDRVTVRDLRVANQLEFEADVNSPGTLAGNMAPRQLCSVATIRTDLAGKSFRGRIYLGGFTVAAMASDGNQTSTIRDSVEVFGQQLLGFNVAGSLCLLGVASRLLGVTTPAETVVSRDEVWDWQRSRATIG